MIVVLLYSSSHLPGYMWLQVYFVTVAPSVQGEVATIARLS